MIRAKVLYHLPGAGESKKERSKGAVGRGESEGDVRRVMSRVDVRVIEGKKVRGDDPIEYFFPTGD